MFQIGEVRSIKFDQQPNADKGYRTIVFNSEYSNERTNSSVSSIVVYPNPVAEYIVVFGVEEMDEVVIMTIDGVVVSRSQGSRIDVSKLQQGSYILTVNGKLVKFIKK
ncbi:MAG: T9SS type A sorting domain-containing protein [Paludibacteraceae bacterium]|nr:T9SS type A sorting domain-containing protein [Paludibacteraceae bacterium]